MLSRAEPRPVRLVSGAVWLMAFTAAIKGHKPTQSQVGDARHRSSSRELEFKKLPAEWSDARATLA